MCFLSRYGQADMMVDIITGYECTSKSREACITHADNSFLQLFLHCQRCAHFRAPLCKIKQCRACGETRLVGAYTIIELS